LWLDAIIDPAHTRDAIIWALNAAALNTHIPDFKTGVLQT
jgi:acetyl-CoA carboxylase carboxyltransferase component